MDKKTGANSANQLNWWKIKTNNRPNKNKTNYLSTTPRNNTKSSFTYSETSLKPYKEKKKTFKIMMRFDHDHRKHDDEDDDFY